MTPLDDVGEFGGKRRGELREGGSSKKIENSLFV